MNLKKGESQIPGHPRLSTKSMVTLCMQTLATRDSINCGLKTLQTIFSALNKNGELFLELFPKQYSLEAVDKVCGLCLVLQEVKGD